MEKGMVTISAEEYDYLKKQTYFLECLEAAGVDNWQGYDDAWEIFREED